MRMPWLAVALVASFSSRPALAQVAPGESACAALRQLQVPGAVLSEVTTEWFAAGAPPPQEPPWVPPLAAPMPAYCRLSATLDRRTGADGRSYGIGFALALPVEWNGRFLFQGGGGLNGTVAPPLGRTGQGDAALVRGFAVVTTDTGHRGEVFDASFMAEQQASLDFAYQAVGRVAALAKQILAQHYGRPAAHAYFMGCSTGGREGMLMAQRYPTYFDGIVVGAPAMRTAFSGIGDEWVATMLNRVAPLDASGKPDGRRAFSDADRKAVVDGLLTTCDAADGLRDGIVSDPIGCRFDPSSLRCAGPKADGCLSEPQIEALAKAFGGPKDSKGRQVYPGFPFDTGIAASQGIPGLLAGSTNPVGPPFTATEMDVDKRAEDAAAQPQVQLTSTSSWTSLNTFSSRGGKLIFFHGVSDPWFSALDTVDYFERMTRANGGASVVTGWSRLFLVPGMGHCGGGPATLDTFDMLGAVVDWVEHQKPPQAVRATGRSWPGRSRPLCPYPSHAHHIGTGDVEDAASFECRSPDAAADQAPPKPLLASVFQDHAVLQRDRPIAVWGSAGAGETVSVSMGGPQASARVDASGRWSAELPAMGAGGPFSLVARASSGAAQTLSDVLVGDVLLCSGQSNMELTVSRSRNGEWAASRSADDRLRLLTVPHVDRVAPAAELPAGVAWRLAAPESVRSFSAACYYAGRELQDSLKVPVGLINAAWGGSAAEAWTAEAGLRAAGGFGDRLDLLRLYRQDEAAANQRMGRMWEAWWRTHARTGTEPWQPGLARTGEWTDVPEPMRDWKTWGVPLLARHDGLVWFRRAVTLTPAQASRAATLSLGGIDEVDETWVNGRAIRNTFGWGTDRSYGLPAGVLRAGENVIVVNVLSTWDAGGMMGPAEKLALTFDDGTKVGLGGGWRYQVVPLEIGRPPRAPWESVAGLTTLYNGMIAPLGPFGLRGVVWYQGETNADAPAGYQAILAGLMSSWREQLGADLPFVIVQLPGFGPTPTVPVESGWADVREAQRRAVDVDRHAALVVTIDLGERDDIHPVNKRDVGVRVARALRHVGYGEAIAPTGPAVRSASLEPSRVVVSFRDVEGRLVTYSSGQATGFELCGEAPGSCRFVSGTVEADRVVIPMDGGAPPTRLRFCWGGSPVCNLSDGSGLPVGPFEVALR